MQSATIHTTGAGLARTTVAELRQRATALVPELSQSFKLLTLGNPKTAKNAIVGDATAIMHFAPARLSGFNVCPWASPGCVGACLHTAGNRQYLHTKTRARIARTRLFFEDRTLFLELLRREIRTFARRVVKLGLRPSVRLNGTSDLPFERFGIMEQCHADTHGLGLRFYDYTKSTERAIAQPYPLTYSRSERNDRECATVLACGGTVAVVVSGYGIAAHPRTMPGYTRYFGSIKRRVVDGDVHDARYLDAPSSVVVLRAKGDAIGDTSGFVLTPCQLFRKRAQA